MKDLKNLLRIVLRLKNCNNFFLQLEFFNFDLVDNMCSLILIFDYIVLKETKNLVTFCQNDWSLPLIGTFETTLRENISILTIHEKITIH